MNNKDRARQFMPFSSLRGFGYYIKEKKRQKEERKELSEYEGEILSDKISKIKKGQMIKVKFYNVDFYDETEGIVSGIDFDFKNLTIVKTKIKFEDIIDVSVS